MAAQDIIREWPPDAREAAQLVIDEYGEPDEFTPSRLIWLDRGDWRSIVATRETTPHDFPIPHLDNVEGTVAYRVPPERLTDLGRFDGSVTVKRTEGLMAARCHDQQANMLALNLAHDIATGERTVEEARDHYLAEMVSARSNGSAPYMERLRFRPPAEAEDPDESLVSQDEMQRRVEQKKAA